MEDTTVAIEQLFEKAKIYSETSLKILKYKSVDKTSETLGDLSAKIIVSLVLITAVTLSNIAVALYLGELFGKNYLGFFAISGFYLFLALLIFIFKEKLIVNRVRQYIIDQFLN